MRAKRLTVSLILLFLLFLTTTAFAGEPNVRVGLSVISPNPTTMTIYSGLYNIRSSDAALAPFQAGAGTKLTVRYDVVKDSVYLENIGYFKGSLFVEPVQAGASPNMFTYNSIRYRQKAEIRLNYKKLFTVVNEIPIDDYLQGVVPREMSNSWPLEALKAQAIAARTYALSNINKHSAEGYGLCATDHCQVYGGASSEGSNATAAVQSTSGITAKYADRYISALYASNHGGYSENSENVWGGRYEYCRAVSSPWDKVVTTIPASSWTYQWTKVLTKAQFEDAVNLTGVTKIEITKRTVSGRVAEVKIYYGAGQIKTVTGNYIRQSSILNLNSTMFDISTDAVPSDSPLTVVSNVGTAEVNGTQPLYVVSATGVSRLNTTQPITLKGGSAVLAYGKPFTKVTITGNGWGHGVGLSQWGAYGMAKGFDGVGFNGKKYTYEEILKHYYTGISLVKDY